MDLPQSTPPSRAWQLWLLPYCLLAISYLFAMDQAYTWQFLHKAAAILLLLAPARLGMPKKYRWPLISAILLSACGDMLLASKLPHQFEMGLGAFLLAHLAYIVLIWPTARLAKGDKFYLFLLLFIFGALASWILPQSHELFIPVAIYMTVICTMATCALLAKPNNVYLLLGAIVFLFSDSLIAINKFIQAFEQANLLIMVSYYLAQYLLVFSLLHQANRR